MLPKLACIPSHTRNSNVKQEHTCHIPRPTFVLLPCLWWATLKTLNINSQPKMAQAYMLILHLKPLSQLLCNKRTNLARKDWGLQYQWLVRDSHFVFRAQIEDKNGIILSPFCLVCIHTSSGALKERIYLKCTLTHPSSVPFHTAHKLWIKFKLVKKQKACVKYVYTHHRRRIM